MSRVVVTDLVPGEDATSADANATVNSWNAAGAAGSIGAANVRQEGIDRRTLSAAAQVIQAPPAAFADCAIAGSTSSGALTSAVYALIVVGSNLQLGPMTDLTATGSEKVMVRVSVWFTADPNLLVECILQSSADAVTWTDYSESYQAFMVDRTNATPGDRPPSANCVGSYTATVAVAPSASRVYWRAAYRVTPGGGGAPGVNVYFQYGVLSVEEYAK